MRAKLIGLGLVLLAGCGGQPAPIDIRVATINLRHSSDWWEDRFVLIGEQLVALDADLIGMQEVEIALEQAELLHQRAADAGLEYGVHQQLKTGLAAVTGEGIALFTRRPFLEQSMIDLSYGRPAIIDRIDLDPEVEGPELTFVNTHLHHQGGDEVRRPQMDAILTAIAGETGPVIMTGDFNATPDSETYAAAVATGFRDAGADAGNTSPIRLIRSSTVAQAPRNRIDYVLVRGAIEVLDARLAFDQPAADGLYPSDHLGLFATLRITR